MTGPWWVELDRDVVAITGPDARAYLQGQISQDVAALPPGHSAWSLVLAPQGKVDAWLRLHARPDDTYIADLDPGFAPLLIERLERFRLRVDVHFEELSWQFAAARGEGVPVPEVAAPGMVAEVDWPGFEGFDVMGPVVEPPPGVEVVDRGRFERARIEAGWPVMGAELTDKTIPAEAGIVDRSVSFTKGCYTGQELVARIDSRGNNTPRRLVRLRGDAAIAPAVGDDVVVGAKTVGSLTSVSPGDDSHQAVALAYLHRSVELPAEVSVPGGTMTALSDQPEG